MLYQNLIKAIVKEYWKKTSSILLAFQTYIKSFVQSVGVFTF